MGTSKKRIVTQRGFCPTQNKQEQVELTYVEITTLSSPHPQYKEMQMFCPHISLRQGICGLYDACPVKNSLGEDGCNKLQEQIRGFIVQAGEIETERRIRSEKSQFGFASTIGGKAFEQWKSDLLVFVKRNLSSHELYDDLLNIIESYKTKTLYALDDAVGILESIHKDNDYFVEKNTDDKQISNQKFHLKETELPRNTHDLLLEIVNSDNPVDMLEKRFNGLAFKDDEMLRAVLRELSDMKYINIQWASDVPYIVTINNNARTYVAEYERDELQEETTMKNSSDVFIVHGHNEEALAKTENFVRKMGLNPIILRDQASGGKTIIEKIESYTDIDYGIVLYTSCDEMKDGKFRARQNVVLEHGYLMGKLKRERVAALVKGNVEIPGDIDGIVYIQMDDGKDWERQLVKELQAAGYNADANKI